MDDCEGIMRQSMVTLTVCAAVLCSDAARARGQCVGDCRGSGAVAINDLITMVNIALGTGDLTTCRAGDADKSDTITINEIISAVNHALSGCPATPTNSPTPSATATGTPSATPTESLTPLGTAATPTPTANASASPTAEFDDNGDGTITDTRTGLTWEKKDQAGGLHDSNTRFPSAGICTDNGEFCQPDAAAATTCNAATGGAMGCAQCGGTATCHTILGTTTIWDWLNQLNAASFAGHSDWRIPTVGRDGGTVQLETIVDTGVSGCGGGAPCVPRAFDTGCVAGCTATSCSCTQAERYWSATSIVGNLPFPSAWGVFFRTGEVQGIDKASAFYVRVVRGGS
jgi:uncharacterized protein DUF1566